MFTNDELFEAIALAETGGESDPFIRTRVAPKGGSTAYGPVQITGTLARDYLDRKKDLFSPEEKDYLKRFLDQAGKFSTFGLEPEKEGYNTRYDYGGEGVLRTEEDKATYKSVAEKMLGDIYSSNGSDIEKTIRDWRFGPNSSKGRGDDETYFKKVESALPEPVEAEPEAQYSEEEEKIIRQLMGDFRKVVVDSTESEKKFSSKEEEIIQTIMKQLRSGN